MKYTKAYKILEDYQFQDWNSLTDEYKQKLDDMKETSLKALKICALNDKITNLYNQYNSTSSPKSKKDLYKAIKRLEGKRRKEKLEKEGGNSVKAKVIIDMPNSCAECPLQAIFFDSEWNIQHGIKHYSCRLRQDRATKAGGGKPDYCPLIEVKDEEI